MLILNDRRRFVNRLPEPRLRNYNVAPGEVGLTLELHKVTGQLESMGNALAGRRQELSARADDARAALAGAPVVTPELEAKIRLARRADAWQRGAEPLGDRLDERVRFGAPPARHTLIAVDGSQILPDRHAAAAYYLTNIGTVVLRAGSGEAPEVETSPRLYYDPAETLDAEGRLRTPEFVGALRSEQELEALADLVEIERDRFGGESGELIIALTDGPLLPWIAAPGGAQDTAQSREMDRALRYAARQHERIRQAGGVALGYIDRPGSAFVLRLLELIEIRPEEITRERLRAGPYRELVDRLLFAGLAPAERSGLFRASTASHERYRALAPGNDIIFAYANMGRDALHAPVRIEAPGWVATDPDRMDAALAAIHANCVPVPYPYVLTRAHELAVVGEEERRTFEQMLAQSMWSAGMVPEISLKSEAKKLVRSRR